MLPALIRRYDEAARAGAESVTNWGTGTPRRELLHVDDLASAVLHLLEHHDGPQQVDVGTGTDVTIAEVAAAVATVTGFEGRTDWDTNKPDGTPQKLLGVSQLADPGWTATISLEDGLRATHEWYLEHRDRLRG